MTQAETIETGTGFIADATLYSLQMNLPKPQTYSPQADITAYELARLLPILLGHHFGNIPDDLKRHFKEPKELEWTVVNDKQPPEAAKENEHEK